MKISTSKYVITLSSLALALALTFAFALPSGALAAAPKEGAMMAPGQSAERHLAMKAHHDKMMVEMKAQDAELAKQIAAIKSAPENQKMKLMIALVTSMVEQRTAMHENMSEMMNNMMDNMPMKDGAKASTRMMKGM